MIEFMQMEVPFVVTFDGEGRACYVKQTAREVFDFLMLEEGGGFCIDSEADEVTEWLNDDDHWRRDEGGNPFEWSFDIGEMSSVTVTKITSESESWPRKLVKLVGECIKDQRAGYDVLASATWDDVVSHWGTAERVGE